MLTPQVLKIFAHFVLSVCFICLFFFWCVGKVKENPFCVLFFSLAKAFEWEWSILHPPVRINELHSESPWSLISSPLPTHRWTLGEPFRDGFFFIWEWPPVPSFCTMLLRRSYLTKKKRNWRDTKTTIYHQFILFVFICCYHHLTHSISLHIIFVVFSLL